MTDTRLVATSAGPVEITRVPGNRPPVLFFPGGHCSATCDCGWSLYTDLGHALVSFSRPGYGRTRVRRLSPAEFAPLVREVCAQLGIKTVAAVVGVSFGGMQAVHVARDEKLGVPRLVLHSCAPSVLPYPDTRAEAIVGPVIFSPVVERLVWLALRRTVRSDAGLRRVVARLSALPVDEWWDQWSDADRDDARRLFQSMRSDAGFITDLQHGRARDSAARRDALSAVRCETLVTGSRHDRGVSFTHAESLAVVIPRATLIELDAPSHLFWIGPGRARLGEIVSTFISRDNPVDGWTDRG